MGEGEFHLYIQTTYTHTVKNFALYIKEEKYIS